MSEPVKNENANVVEEPKAPVRMSLRRKQAQGIVEPESKVERPNTVPVFQASPTSVAGVLAKQGTPLETMLTWGSGENVGSDAGGIPAGIAPVLVVGAGRELLAELLAAEPDLHVGHRGTVLALKVEAVERNRTALAHEGLPEQYWYKKIGDEFAAGCAAEAPGRRPVEVIDTKVLPLDTLDRVFPRSLVVNVVPRWLQGGVRTTRRSVTLPAGRYLEVRITDVKASPEIVKRRVLEFLGEFPSSAAGEVA